MDKPLKRRSGPTERQRVLWALTGFIVPAVGAVGRWPGEAGGWPSIPVRVTRVSATGKTVWVRFLGKLPVQLLRSQKAEYAYSYWPQERRYLSSGTSSPYGELVFDRFPTAS